MLIALLLSVAANCWLTHRVLKAVAIAVACGREMEQMLAAQTSRATVDAPAFHESRIALMTHPGVVQHFQVWRQPPGQA